MYMHVCMMCLERTSVDVCTKGDRHNVQNIKGEWICTIAERRSEARSISYVCFKVGWTQKEIYTKNDR